MDATKFYTTCPSWVGPVSFRQEDMHSAAVLIHRLWSFDGRDPASPACTVEGAAAQLRWARENGEIFLAMSTDTDEAIGILVCIPAEGYGEASGFYVDAERNPRVATSLLRHGIDWFKQVGIQEVRISTSCKGVRGERSRAYYKRMGFVPTDIIHAASVEDIAKGIQAIEAHLSRNEA